MRFFRRVYTVLKPGGTFVFEPQEWDGYAKAKRMDTVSTKQRKVVTGSAKRKFNCAEAEGERQQTTDTTRRFRIDPNEDGVQLT